MDFIETDAKKIYDEIITSVEKKVGESLYPGDERRLFSNVIAAIFIAMFNQMNDASKQKMLRYARGDVLDALGERVGVERQAASPAETTLRFSVDAAFSQNIIIPKGTRATGDSTRFFATTTNVVITAGELYVDVPAQSVGGGVDYNDIAVGAINVIVDPVPYVDAVSNTTVTSGGTDTEDDDSLRERIRIAPSTLSTAGPIKSYEYWAKTADTAIADVVVSSEQTTLTRTLPVANGKAYKGGSQLVLDTLVVYLTDGTTAAKNGTDYTAEYTDDLLTISLLSGGALAEAETVKIDIDTLDEGVVRIVPLLDGGEIPDEGMLQKVYDAVNADDVRPLTDKVIVEAPQTVEFDIEFTYYTTAENESACIETIEGEGGAIDRYIAWQTGAIGRDINPDKLRAFVLAPDWEGAVGAYRIDVVAPAFRALGPTTVAKFSGTRTVKHEVVEE